MRVINKSKKIIGVANEPLLPGKDMILPEGYESHPTIQMYFKKGVIADADAAVAPVSISEGISGEEKTRIAEAAIAQYKAEQEAITAAKTEKEAVIKAVKGMKKEELITKAMSLGIEVADSDGVDVLKEKIIKMLNE